MALPFFYEPTVAASASLFELSEETSKHCIQVLRMRTGERMQLTNGKGGLYTASIAHEDKKHCTVNIESAKQYPVPEKKTTIAVSLLKNASRFEWFLEKATEVGVTEIIPLICSRTEHTRFRFERMQQILISAMLQSQQSWLPVLHEPIKLQALFEEHLATQKFIAHCEEDNKTPIHSISLSESVLMLIGPEGDFTPEEIRLAIHHAYQPVSLGNTRLRTETAAIVASTFLSIR
ncbi:MAG: 16S rRNA (uracil(1498)-N(3))-methyltransferase [Sediminibacterium sp. Gen4]|jgi:16S rRNA (uracil1498-N3)-methyltransferase|uniref:RsmE family RNA methyltransferase n=1 Tax=unclassified Sediminibacterium TaxID=2635961 RepID=UPI0015BA2D24|nr:MULTISPECIES: RsmE family RNA methyltransferase [unclassified Sediminibacterium]MBW0161993.1 16S rRNA (uracil(1498)-N(3))-methyltransferase [Sediminibacterium sp.]MBW0163408.1 16S rRNA (uracil(1498)-N(3))-methyltransferase [Sediminibacterium sp.]NWK67509.1 16S rRNA (uracil(1498)-N(3))-methyltransferase [Sediminibacterium sp. Gen4]